MKSTAKILFLLIAAALILVRFFLLDSQPWLEPYHGSTQQLSTRAHQILEAGTTHATADGLHIQLRLTAEDIETASLFLLASKNLIGRTSATFNGPHLDLRASIAIPFLPYYINARLSLLDHDPISRIEELRMGELTFEGHWIHDLIPQILTMRSLGGYQLAGLGGLESLRVNHHHLGLTVDWTHGAEIKAKSLTEKPDDLERVIAYRSAIASVVNTAASDTGPISLTDLIIPLFNKALERSKPPASALKENRALIQTLSAYTNGYDILSGQPAALKAAAPVVHTITLKGRHDLAQHFMSSAALGLAGDKDIADMIGIAKEMSDSHGGSGFSFTDLTADRAGVRLGQQAAASETAARTIQERIVLIVNEDSYMPSIDNLPQDMDQTQFQKDYDSVISPAFRAITRIIDGRVEALVLYHP